MNDLIERLERATGPDRKLDFAIHEAVYGPGPRLDPPGTEGPPPGFGEDAINLAMDPRPHYTASLDAARSEIPSEWRVTHAYWDGERAVFVLGRDSRQWVEGKATSPERALMAAALKAKDFAA